MSLPDQLEKFILNTDLIGQVAQGDKDTVVQTAGGPVPSVAKLLHDSQAAIADAVEAQLELAPRLASPAGADMVGAAAGGTVQDVLDAQQQILGSKEPVIVAPPANPTLYYWRGDKSWQQLNKAAVGLSNVSNTADSQKPVSQAQAAADTAVLEAAKSYADSAVSKISTFKTGDVVISARKDYATPAWLPCDGSTYLKSSYPDLAALLNVNIPGSKFGNVSAAGTGTDVAYSSDGVYFVIGAASGSYYSIYKKNSSGNYLTHSTAPNINPPGLVYTVAFSPDTSFLFMGGATSPYFRLYLRTGDAFSSVAISGTGFPSYCRAAAFSPDGQYLAVAHDGSPKVTICRATGVSGTPFTMLNPPATLPNGVNGRGVAWSPDGTLLAVACAGGTVSLYKKTDNVTFTKIADPTGTSYAAGGRIAFSPDGNYLVATGSGTDFAIYKRGSGDAFDRLPNPVLPAGVGQWLSAAWSPDGLFLVVGGIAPDGVSSIMAAYRRYGDAFSKIGNPSQLPPGAISGIAFSPDGNLLAMGTGNSPFAIMYSAGYDTTTLFKVPFQDGAGLPGYIKT